MKKTCMNRRAFIARSTAVAAGTLLPNWALALSAGRTATDQIVLGKTGIKASRIAMGTGFSGGGRSSAQVRQGKEVFVRLMHHGFDSGLNFFDMADLYGSHNFMASIIKEIGRDRMVLLSKIWFAEGGGMEPTDRAIPSIDRFRKELGTEMIDICLIHCVTNANWPSQLKRMRDELDAMKQQGVIKATGVSCHDFGALQVAAADPWVDVIFARINNRAKVMDHEDPAAVSAVLKQARANGKAVVGMKIYGAGQLVTPAEREDSLRYVWNNQLIDAMTIGFEQPEHVSDTVSRLNSVFAA